jgi:sensor histidine kinase YesM
LAEEIETIQLYVNIENIRFDNQINFTVKIEEELDLHGIKVPSLILQSFVENAIWHGLPLVDRKQLTILVKKESEKEIKIAIEDNGIGMKRSKEINRQKFHQRRSVGLQITKERLQIFYKDYEGSYSLTYAELNPEKENPGTRVELRIPLS